MSIATTAEADGLPDHLGRIAHATWFTRVILGAIALTGILSGLETYPLFRGEDAAGRAVDLLQNLVLGVFVVEIAIKLGSYGRQPWRYFTSGWNVFDFMIVLLCLLPLHAEYVVVLRLLRTLRLFTALHGLQIMLSGLLRGIPSLGYVGLLLLLHFYIYAVIGTFMFGDNDPIRFGSLHTSMLTLFQVLTLEGWNDILNTQYHGSDIGYDEGWKTLSTTMDRTSVARPIAAAAYFVSFILIGTMIMLNLFTGVIIKSMEEAHIEAAEEARLKRTAHAQAPTAQERVLELSQQLQSIADQLSALKMEREPGGPREG